MHQNLKRLRVLSVVLLLLSASICCGYLSRLVGRWLSLFINIHSNPTNHKLPTKRGLWANPLKQGGYLTLVTGKKVCKVWRAVLIFHQQFRSFCCSWCWLYLGNYGILI